MIADPHLASELTAEPADFSYQVHGRIFDATARIDVSQDLPSEVRRGEIIEAADDPLVQENFLDMLVGQCPEPGHGHVYARLVQEAAVRRMIAWHADRLGQQAASLGYDARRLIRTAGEPGFEPEHLSLHMAKVATALRSHAVAFDPAIASVIGGPAHPADLGELLHSAQFWTMASGGWGNVATRVAARYASEQAEEHVLIALLQNHPHSAQVLDSLSAAEFGDYGRRRIFTAIRELHQRDNPVDPLIVDWEIARNEATQPGTSAPERCWAHPEATGDSYVTRLAKAAIDPEQPLTIYTDAMLSNRYRLRDYMPRDVAASLRAETGRADPAPVSQNRARSCVRQRENR